MAEGARGELLVCNCSGTMEIDGKRLAHGLGGDTAITVHRELCRAGIDAFDKALQGGRPLHVACTQEAPLFSELAAEAGRDPGEITFTNIRERAGWTSAGGDALAKMVALLEEATYTVKPAGSIDLKSGGVCLVHGAGQQALDVAMALSGKLSVTLLLSDVGDAMPPERATVAVYKGRIKSLKGHLGAFEVLVDGYAAALPFSRAGMEFAMLRDGARSSCDLVLDMSGGAPPMSEPNRRDGYVRVDPAQPLAVAKAMLDIGELVGEFEKPLYVGYDAGICAHARSGKVGCRNCLDACPMGAITPAGDGIAIDPFTCAGCGNCSSVCPTGAVSHAFPSRADVIGRGRVLLDAYRRAGGEAPVLLLHTQTHGTPLISAMARYCGGLPANVLPMSLATVTAIGHEVLAALLAAGARHVALLVDPKRRDELRGLTSEIALLEALTSALGHDAKRLHLWPEQDPDIVAAHLRELPRLDGIARSTFAVAGSKREIARLALAALHAESPKRPDSITLPRGAPYGRIDVKLDACTLCLACVGACPAGALAGHPERPELSFTEAACVQCGVCVATCPESAIRLDPRYDFTSTGLRPHTLKSEPPFTCIECGKPFGAKSSIDRVVQRLQGHAMFRNEAQQRLIQLCDTCRVTTLTLQGGDPLEVGRRPRIRTTDDYLEAEKSAARTGRKLEDFLDD